MAKERLYFIDRLRFIAVVILIFFHSGLIFAEKYYFHIKNDQLSAVIENVIYFLHSWRLALLFFISGVGTSFALRFRNKNEYMKERFKRLFIPLIFGILVVVPPQIYYERISQGFENGSYLEFWLQSFSTGFYPYGNISWHHLWFVAYLLIYSVVSVPLFFYIKNNSSERFDKFIAKLGVIFWAVPLALLLVLLKPYSTGIQNIVNDLAMFSFYWLVFISGFLVQNKNFWSYIESKITTTISLSILFTLTTFYIHKGFSDMSTDDFLYFFYSFAKGCSAWLWILTILALGKKYLNKPGKYLPLLNESVYPVYIFHQTAIICIGYYVVQTNWTLGVKLFTVIALTILICWSLFLFFRKFNLTRLVFGMKWKIKRQCQLPARPVQNTG